MSEFSEDDDMTEISMTLVAALIDTVNETTAAMLQVHEARAQALNAKNPVPGSIEEAEIGTKGIAYNYDAESLSRMQDLGQHLAGVFIRLEAINASKASDLRFANEETDSRLAQASNAITSRSMM
jgi:hypothetical protein